MVIKAEVQVPEYGELEETWERLAKAGEETRGLFRLSRSTLPEGLSRDTQYLCWHGVP